MADDDAELNAAQADAMWRLLEVISARDTDFPLRNAERSMYNQAWGLALRGVEETLLGHPLMSDAEVSRAYSAVDQLLPRDEDGQRLPYGFKFERTKTR